MLITSEELRQIATSLNAVRAQQMAGLINDHCAKYNCTNPLSFKMFLANVIQESGEFALKSENMNYTSANRIHDVWPSRFPTIQSALPFVKNPQGLANKVYGNRMGNIGADDGWLFRGAGFIGITGRDTYHQYAAFINKTPEVAAELMRTTDEFALDSALWFFCILKNLIPLAERGQFIPVVKKINGGLIGLDQRKKYYERCNNILA